MAGPLRRLAGAALGLWLSATDARAAATRADPQLWLMAMPVADYMGLVTRPEAWPDTLAGLKVFQTTTFNVSIMADQELASLFAFLKRHHVALGMESDMQTPGQDGCGENLEGYRPPGFMKALAARIKADGGDLAFIAMDEPLFFGRYATTFAQPVSRFCQATPETIAKNVARVVADVRESFPDVAVGDVEPVTRVYREGGDDPVALRQWLDAFRRATGRPLAFLHFDVPWEDIRTFDPVESRFWTAELQTAAALATANGIRTGIIYNGSQNDMTSALWVDRAASRYETIEGRLGLTPDDAVIETWMPLPARILPETQPDTLTGLAARYLRWRKDR